MKKPPAKTIFVVLLAVGAVAMMASTLTGGRSRSRRNSGPTAPANPTAHTSATGAATTSPAPATAAVGNGPATHRIVPREPIDVTAVLANLPRWTESPTRDPFSVFEAPRVVERVARAADLLSLKAILRQTGGRLAVINNRVVAEGERVAGFRIEVIEPNQVQVRGSNGLERIDFSTSRARATLTPTNGPAKPSLAPGPGPARDRTLSS